MGVAFLYRNNFTVINVGKIQLEELTLLLS